MAFDFGRYRIERDDKGTWAASGDFAAATDQPLSQDDFNRWADEWRLTSALSVEPDKDSPAREQVSVRFKSGKTVTMRIVQKEPDFQLVRSDNAMRYHFGVEVGRRLLDPRVVAKKVAGRRAGTARGRNHAGAAWHRTCRANASKP